MAWDINEEYFNGQGSVLVSKRDSAGKPLGFRHLGNVSTLTLSTSRSYNTHKESKSGNRATDRRTISETAVTMNAACENFSSENLKLFTQGLLTKIAEGSVTDGAFQGAAGSIVALDHIKVSNVVVKNGATTLVAYVNDATAYDYKINAEAGSIRLNETGANLGIAVSDLVEGSTTTITASISGVEEGDQVVLTGVAGADAADINGLQLTVTQVLETGVVVAFNSTGKTLDVTSAKLYGAGIPLTISYDYRAQDLIDALAGKETEVYLRFEGLNTAEDQKPVVVDIFKVGITPIAELALFGDAIQSASIAGEVLSDPLREEGSKFYTVRKL